MEEYDNYENTHDSSGGDRERKFDDRPLDGLGGYGDDDYSDVKSLVSANKQADAEKIDNFKNFPEIGSKTVGKLQGLGINYLFPIQEQCFRPIFDGKDVIGRDLTGSGKTLAFSIPLVEKFRKEGLFEGRSSLKAIILAPTRELALQVSKVLKCLRHHGDEFKVITVYGGVPIHVQTKELQNGVDFFVGTTGRVMDHIRRGNINFSSMKAVVLDEADQMLNMGFAEDIESIMNSMKEKTDVKQQFILFSATIPEWFKATAQNYMTDDYQYINLAENLKNKTPRNVSHVLIRVGRFEREPVIENILSCYLESDKSKAIIFTTTKNDAREISQLGMFDGKAEALHGDVPQRSREFVLKRFRQGRTNTLVATDVASRGLDIPRVDLIIQIEPPKDPEQYIHRSGRTARAGNAGVCVTLCDRRDEQWIEKITDQAGVEFNEMSPDDLEEKCRSSGKVQKPKSLIGGQRGYITYQILGAFADKKEAYMQCCEALGKGIVNKFKNVTMYNEPQGVCFDVEDSLSQELQSTFETAKRDKGLSYSLEKPTSLPSY